MKNYKVRAKQNFTYKEFDTLEFVEKGNFNGNFIYENDIFCCTKEQYEYLNGKNNSKVKAVELLEVQETMEEMIDNIVEEVIESKEVEQVIDEVVEEIIGKKKKSRKK